MICALVEALETDPDLTQYPRLKVRDDATYVRGNVGTARGQ
jgi:hypothetical protein